MAADIHLDSVIARSATPIAADVAGEMVLMSLERSKCYGLGVAGTEVWKRLENPIRISELVAQFAREYDADPSIIERDLLDLFRQLQSEGLVEVRSS